MLSQNVIVNEVEAEKVLCCRTAVPFVKEVADIGYGSRINTSLVEAGQVLYTHRSLDWIQANLYIV